MEINIISFIGVLRIMQTYDSINYGPLIVYFRVQGLTSVNFLVLFLIYENELCGLIYGLILIIVLIKLGFPPFFG